MAGLIRIALCRISVGGVEARIHRMTAFRSILCRGSLNVEFLSVPSSDNAQKKVGVSEIMEVDKSLLHEVLPHASYFREDFFFAMAGWPAGMSTVPSWSHHLQEVR
jgi:hypothetical protein